MKNKIILMSINIIQLKRQLNIEVENLEDDIILQHFLDVAESAVGNYLGIPSGTTIDDEFSILPQPVLQATILLAAHFYINRNMVSFSQGSEIPYSFQFLLNPFKNYIIS